MKLLSPAGHWEAMVAAVQNGADAVYLGLETCNARQNAKNFTAGEFPLALDYCHLRGVQVYLTLNTLLSDRELPEAEKILRDASRLGADAVIVQDWGLAALARETAPDLPLHASTQMTLHTLSGVEQAAGLGMRCAVLSRELSAPDIRRVCARSPIPIEVFVHGALCMCWSGQCAMSALIGQRSGNRGLCAQPCRLPYRFDGGRAAHPLSLKDMSLAAHIAELQDMGVSLLKLEGRMKRPEYVAIVTRIYANLIRENRLPTCQEQEQLVQAFSREGFTDAYWRGSPAPGMLGVRPENAASPDALFNQAKGDYSREDRRRIPVRLTAQVLPNRPALLTVTDPEGRRAQAEGPVPEPARTRSLTARDLQDRLSKTGGTVYQVEEAALDVGENLSLPASAVNALRREALAGLTARRVAAEPRRERPAPPLPENISFREELAFTVYLSAPRQLTSALLELSPAVLYLPAERIEGFDLLPSCRERYPETEFCAALPRVCKDSEERSLLRLLERAKEKGCTSLAVQNIGQLPLAERLGLTARGDYGLNVFNSRSLSELQSWGLKSACLSFELRRQQIRDLRKPLPCEAIVYGRLPLMITENCLFSNAGAGCAVRRGVATPCSQPHSITDRKNEVFPVLPVFGCRSEIENSKELFLADKPDYRRIGLRYARLRFTTETPQECVKLLARYQERNTYVPQSYTRGLFYRGVE